MAQRMVTITPRGDQVTQMVTDEEYAQAQTRHDRLAMSGKYSDAQITSLRPQPAPPAQVTGLLAYSAAKRYEKADSGTTVNDVPIQTDQRTRQAVTAAVTLVQTNPQTIRWKTATGEFVTLDTSQVLQIGQGVHQHTQDCFTTEATLADAIQASPPTVTSKAEIDAAYAAIGSSKR
jgi:Domain of unknown function (DUF4376)